MVFSKFADLVILGRGVWSSGWMGWLVLAIQIFVVGQILRAWVGPKILGIVSKRVQVRRVSLRSIRGVYVRLPTMTIRIDRVGISYHRSLETTRRFSLKVEGLWVELHEVKVPARPPRPVSRRFTRLPSLAIFSPSPIARWIWSLYSSVYASLEPHLRPIVRTVFVTFTRIVIRCLPLLTQVIDFELERAILTFTTVPEAHLTVRSITLSAAVEFSNLENVVDAPGNYPAVPRHRRFSSMAHLRTRFTKSVKRAWGRAWGRTRGSASLHLKVRNVIGLASTVKWPQVNPDSSSAKHVCASRFAFVTHSSHSDDVSFELPNAIEIAVSVQFGNTQRIIREHSVHCSLKMPSVEFSANPCSTFLDAIRKLRKKADSPLLSTDNKISTLFKKKGRRRLRSSKASLFRRIEASIENISVRHVIWSKDGHRPRYFVASIRCLSSSIEFGEPKESVLYRDFLGSWPEKSPYSDTEVISYKVVANEITVQRRSAIENASPLRVVSINSVHLQGFTTQWRTLGLPSGDIFPGDPNAALLVVKLNILAPQFSERVDVVTDILDNIEKQSQDASTPHEEPRHVIRCVPRMKLDLVVDDIATCLSPPESDQHSALPLILSSTQCVISISSYFRFFPLGRSTLPEIRGADFIPLDVHFTVYALLGPVFVMTLPNPFALDEVKSLHRHPGATEDPLLSLSILECSASGEILGVLQDSTDEVILDIDSMITDVKCMTDAISVELWQPSVVLSLQNILNSGRDLSNAHSKRESALLKSLPDRVTAHFAIGRLVMTVAGKDINPNEDSDLSRGLAIRSGFLLQYCSMHDRRLFVRFPRRFAHAHDRQRLYLSEDLLYDAVSMTSASVNKPAKFALFRCATWDVALRTSVATEYAADQLYESNEEFDELKSTEFLWIRRLEVNALSRYFSEGHDPAREQLQLTVRVPSIQARVELAIIYSALLAFRKLGSFGKRREGSASKERSLQVTIKATVTTVQVMLKLPLQEQGCLRINGLILRSSGASDLIVEWGSLFAWVPSSQVEGQWEEILRLRSWKVDCNLAQRDHVLFAVIGEGARLRIPHRYIIADLILDINLFVKCVKHLLRTTSSGVFEPMPSPQPEEAKVVPAISVQVGCLCLEASDDPFESKLGLIWRAGFEAARSRQDREEAFQEKVAAIKSAEVDQVDSPLSERRFGPAHTVSVEEARERLLLVHSLSWMTLHREYRDKQRRNEINVRKEVRGEHFHLSGVDTDPLVPVMQSAKAPPLVRFMTTHVKLDVSAPKFPKGDLPEFLHDLGKGLPHDTRFTLLIPMHLRISLGSTCVTLRDYPLPLLNIVQDSLTRAEAWVVDTNFVIAEELGRESSVVWRECPIVHADPRSPGTESMFLSIPKTTMPVKTYANPTVHVLTSQLAEFCWCNSYQPALQDVMRIFDTLTTPPPDPSPLVGFWDKIRLVLHWRAEFNFANDVHLNLKGSRDPFATDGDGAGFSFCWHGHTKMMVGQANPDNELLQVCSDTMLVVIPEYYKRPSDEVIGGGISSRFARGPVSLNQGLEGRRDSFKKICAKFSSGIKWGIGIVLERTCEQSCTRCNGKLSCRLFDFLPHYEVRLRPKRNIPAEHTPEDSYNGFRSDFIHFSTSLASSVGHKALPAKLRSSNFHLTPKIFAHFWSWWGLFDRYLSVPIRQGRLFPNARPPSKKFGRHLATIKYRIDVQRLFISHMYLDDSRESWSEGVTHCVGVKGLVHSFEADLHQREQEAIVPGVVPNTLKKTRHKPFYAAEVKLTNLQLSAFSATFTDPTKGLFDLQDGQREGKYKDVRPDEVSESVRESWYDMDDFVELGWEPPENASRFCIFPVTSCPRFTYLRRSGNQPHHRSTIESSRFGDEDSHVCLMGKEKSVRSLQADIIGRRILELRERIALLEQRSTVGQMQYGSNALGAEMQRIQRSIRQLEGHVEQLQESYSDEAPSLHQSGEYAKYLMPSEISFPVDWTEFDNVYQAHCPKFRLGNSTREILTQYYYCSRARRGLEYHMATRAVKYIRDQLKAHSRVSTDTDTLKKTKNSTSLAAQVAAQALKRILIGNDDQSTGNAISEASGNEEFDPMAGWSDEVVSQNKSHFCLLLKPQIILRTEGDTDSVLVLAALQAMLQSHTILDTANIDDPISGRVMSRTHAVLSELQAFSPTATCPHRHDGVPLEVLLDLRAESVDFDRLVPQTNATLRHDKFNRLRLRNDVTSAIPDSTDQSNSHLQHQTDLIHIRVPRFTVLASSRNFEDITNIITTLLLRSDNAHKRHLSKVETLLFSYDFTDLSAAAEVVEGLQSRLRRAREHERDMESLVNDNDGQGYSELMRMKAHIFLLSEELNLIFDAINLAQQKAHDKNDDMKMALKVHASAREISWGMVNGLGGMIAKLAIRDIEHNWLNRQDGSTVNNLVMVDLQAFDGSQDAEWPEVLSKHREPSSHPLVKRGIFLQADWAVLAPVGGITIFERFILELHPIRLQLEARIGKNIMEYIWPARRERRHLRHGHQSSEEYDSGGDVLLHDDIERHSRPNVMSRLSLDVSSSLHARKRHSTDETLPTLGLPSRRLTSSRSFTDLRAMSRQNSMNSGISDFREYSSMNKSRSELAITDTDKKRDGSTSLDISLPDKLADDAAEMKTRSSQKTFVLVRISSMHILLSFHKDGSFFCRDARIHTRELQYHNQTWSFEELAEQFIPSDTSWRGWMRVALHQPLVPVLPVARELITKTKWGSKKDKGERRTRKIVKPKPRKSNETPDTAESLAQS